MFLGGRALPVYLFGHLYCKMYRLATMHSVTDRQTDRQSARHTTLYQ